MSEIRTAAASVDSAKISTVKVVFELTSKASLPALACPFTQEPYTRLGYVSHFSDLCTELDGGVLGSLIGHSD